MYIYTFLNRLSWKTVLPIRMCFLLSVLGGDDDGQQTMCALRFFFISLSFSIFSLYMTNWQMMFSLDYIMGRYVCNVEWRARCTGKIFIKCIHKYIVYIWEYTSLWYCCVNTIVSRIIYRIIYGYVKNVFFFRDKFIIFFITIYIT